MSLALPPRDTLSTHSGADAEPRTRSYAYYSYSGAKDVVDTARSVSGSAKAAKDKVADLSPSSAKEALGLAKSVAKSYAAAIPGGAVVIDQGFDRLESFLDEHGEKAAQVVKETYADISEAAKGGKDAQDKILKALTSAADKVQKLVGEEAEQGWAKLGEKYPELQKTLGDQGVEFKKLADKQCVHALSRLALAPPPARRLTFSTSPPSLQRPRGAAPHVRLLPAVGRHRVEGRPQRRDVRGRQEAPHAEEERAVQVLGQGRPGRVERVGERCCARPRQDA